jgi:pimeloyl-ACP methyl ester carboxylesterase
METTVVTTASGVDVPIRSVGNGPGLVILHGAAVGLRDYERLAAAFADRFTVHLYNRRGRPDAAPLDRRTYSIATDLADLAAVLQHTGAGNVFGHSGGGFVALRAGLSLPVSRIAVYDPGVAVSGRPSYAFLAAFSAAIDGGDYSRALSEMTRGVYPDGPAAKLPPAVQRFASRLFLRTSVGQRMADLLPTVPPEVGEIAASDGPASDYAGITAEVLLTSGARSPRYFAENCAALAEAIPRGRALVLPQMSHNAANVAAPDFVAPFRDFFAGAVRPVGA